MSDLKSSLERFSKTAERFNKADTTAEDIKLAEESLSAAKVGLDFWLDQDPNDSLTRDPADEQDGLSARVPKNAREPYRASFLGFVKIGDKWQFAVRHVVDFMVDSEFGEDYKRVLLSVTPLAQAPRTIRVAAARKLPTFIDAFESAINKATPAEGLAGMIEGVVAGGSKKKR